MHATKTTLLLADDLRTQLKELSVRRGTTVTSLLTEGARLVLDRYRGRSDAAELRRRSDRAKRALREGLYAGPAVSDVVDDLLYPVPRRGARRARAR
jgi:hypothetical protein